MRLRAGTFALALAVVLLPATAHAQTVLVQVSDANSAQPLQGTLVVLSDAAGAHVGSALTDARGRFLFARVPPGTYTLRAELIGFSSVEQAVTVVAGETTVAEVRLESRAIELEGLSVEAEGRCELRPEAGLRVADVWDEVRKALEAARWTDQQGVYEYRTRRYLRDVDEESGRVTNQQSQRGRVYLNAPYQSRPAEDLMENGFVQEPTDGGEGEIYYAPDAAVLLSDLFLDSHCMRLRAGDDEEAGLVGLAFEPVRGRRLPDIAGTLWIDPDTWQLSHLEYSYENTDPEVQTRGIGGEVAFQLLPNGTWIVPRWRIRMPLLAMGVDGRGERSIYQIGYREEGAAVLSIRQPGGDVIFSASTAALEGVVLAEFSSEPVAGAAVSLVGTDARTTTDSEGRFRLTDMPPGRYQVVLEHGALQGYGPGADPVDVELAEGSMSSVVLSLPEPFAHMEEACREEFPTRPEGSAILLGRVSQRESGADAAGARVLITWDDFASVRNLGYVNEEGVVATTGPDGRYRACMVPDNSLLRITVQWEQVTTFEDTIKVPENDKGMVHDIIIGGGDATPSMNASSPLPWRQGPPIVEERPARTPLIQKKPEAPADPPSSG